LRIFWHALDDLDAVWTLGPDAAHARLRSPGARAAGVCFLACVADALDAANRAVARHHPVVVVGSDLSHRYRGSTRRHDLTVPLVRAEDVVETEQALARAYDREVRVLSVGRLEAEKNRCCLPRCSCVCEHAMRATASSAAKARSRPRYAHGWRRSGWPTTRTCSATSLSAAACSMFADRVTSSSTCRGPRSAPGTLRGLRVRPSGRCHGHWRERPRKEARFSCRRATLQRRRTQLRGWRPTALRKRLIKAGLDRARACTSEAEQAQLVRFSQAPSVRRRNACGASLHRQLAAAHGDMHALRPRCLPSAPAVSIDLRGARARWPTARSWNDPGRRRALPAGASRG
jgi:hypothetical protein